MMEAGSSLRRGYCSALLRIGHGGSRNCFYCCFDENQPLCALPTFTPRSASFRNVMAVELDYWMVLVALEDREVECGGGCHNTLVLEASPQPQTPFTQPSRIESNPQTPKSMHVSKRPDKVFPMSSFQKC